MSQEKIGSDRAVFLHLSLLSGSVIPIPFAGIFVPLIIWQTGKTQAPHIDQHGRNAINWLISYTIYSTILFVTGIGILLLPILIGLGFVFPIIAAIQASQGKVWQYPLAFNVLGDRPEGFLRRAALGFLALCVLPLAGFLGSALWINHRSHWLDRLSPTLGTVVEVLEKTDEYGDTLYQPVIEFQDLSGESHQVSSSWQSFPSHREGEAVEILYPPQNPEQAIVNTWPDKWLVPVIVLTLSIILLILSLIPSFCCFLISQFV